MNPTTWYHELAAALAPGVAREDGAWPWCRRGVVDAVALPLGGGPLIIHLAAEASRSCLPERWRHRGQEMAVRVERGARPRRQAATTGRAGSDWYGTVGAVMRDRYDASRHFLLTCGHVLESVGPPSTAFQDPVSVQIGSRSGMARLIDWEPVLGTADVRSGIDAAIAEISGETLDLLTAAGLATGVSFDVAADQLVDVRATSPKRGMLKTLWSGFVDVEGTARADDYYLMNAVGYVATPETRPGDSGAGVHDTDGRLLGIHVAAPTGDERWRSNAVFCPIGRILDWFDIDVLVGSGTVSAPLTDQTLAVAPAASVASADAGEAVAIVAKTLWGEARNQGAIGMQAVGCVIANRVSRGWSGARTAAEVCLAPRQFSCWNAGDPNRLMLDRIDRDPDEAFTQALALAQRVRAGTLEDIVDGATHYYAVTMSHAPYWALGHEPCCRIGDHLFFNDIA